MEVYADSAEVLDQIVQRARALGATAEHEQPARVDKVMHDGVFPEGFYSTSNLPTEVLVEGSWVEVENIEMDAAIAVDRDAKRVWCIVFQDAKPGMDVVIGHHGVRVTPLERSRQTEIFSFMGSEVSAEKPKKVLIAGIAEEMRQARAAGGKILVVAGPAVVHTGAGVYLSRLIELGYVQVLFAGNALAVHDVESILFGTALGVNIASGAPIEHGHEHHMRAINRVRAAGGLRQMVKSGQLTGGVMKSAIDHGVEYVLAGSVRDDGPLPDVISDMVEAQRRMRAALKGVRIALMLSTMLHSIATGNMLPAGVRTVCVDINPAVVTKLADRGSWQSVGLVTDVESFLRELALVMETGRHG
jgi:lysine-ketoglutarate reductase/saccharopine dehydrogenase-like protein (TIGR00300 family)